MARKQGIDVPIGFYDDEEWRPISFVEGDEGASLELSPQDLMEWLAHEDFFGTSLMDMAEAEQAVTDTLERCRALAEAVRQDAASARALRGDLEGLALRHNRQVPVTANVDVTVVVAAWADLVCFAVSERP